jgi:outer membrane protein insertion porin family
MVILMQKLQILFFISLIMFFSGSYTVIAETVPTASAIVEKLEWHAPSSIQERFKFYFEDMIGKTWDPVLLKIKIDQINKEIFQSGYLTATAHVETKSINDKVTVSLTVEISERTAFDFNGNKLFSRSELQTKLMDKIKNDFGKTDAKMMINFIIEEYEVVGYYNTSISLTSLTGRNHDGGKIKNYFFKITEGAKQPVTKISLRGAYHFSEEELMTLLNKSGSALAVNKFYDKVFFENFSDIIKKEYLRRGFPFADISFPHLRSDKKEKGIEIEYSVNEKQQVYLNKLSINQVAPEHQVKMKSLLANHEGNPLNILELDKDLKTIVNYLQNEGYYFASITNSNSNNLLVYDKTLSSADLNIDIVTDRQICFNDTIINGNIKTKGNVIYREVNFKPNELITPEKLEGLKHKIASLGLFSTTKITPYMLFDGNSQKCAKTNLVIQVKEKDFGLIELAPGYRTDLGLKLSTNIIYNNLMGMNRAISLKTQLNQRDNLDGFDQRRKFENKKLLEYSIKASVSEPYIFYDLFKTQVESEISSSWQRKRFYGFDADIFRFSPQLSKNFTRYLSSSIKYQFERISQFDATLTKDNDNFSIGSITLSSSIDMRDDPVNTRKGFYLSLSTELANPAFGSMKTSDLEVNFGKIITRNKYYYPLNDFTLAFSLAMGAEKNFAQKGYIPSIKVFRLDGYDEIRGFDDGEINHLASGQAIGDAIVDKTAFFSAFKFEPRYDITDFVQLAIFFDAGRVSVNSFQPLNLRTSAGAGVKFLTAVGALDFSYGIKLHKQTYTNGAVDATGRFHLSIGYF